MHSTLGFTKATFPLTVHSPPGTPPEEKNALRLVLCLLSLSCWSLFTCHSVRSIGKRFAISISSGCTSVRVYIIGHDGSTVSSVEHVSTVTESCRTFLAPDGFDSARVIFCVLNLRTGGGRGRGEQRGRGRLTGLRLVD